MPGEWESLESITLRMYTPEGAMWIPPLQFFKYYYRYYHCIGYYITIIYIAFEFVYK